MFALPQAQAKYIFLENQVVLHEGADRIDT